MEKLDAEKAKLVSRLSRGCPGWAIEASKTRIYHPDDMKNWIEMLTILKGDYNDRFSAAAQISLQFGKKREIVYETLDTWVGWWRDLLLVKTGCYGDIISIDFLPDLVGMARAYNLDQIKTVIQTILEASDQLKLNANPRLVMEALMLNLPSRSK